MLDLPDDLVALNGMSDPKVGYEDIPSKNKCRFCQEAQVNQPGESRSVRHKMERCVPAQLSSS
jgi:hypothetical protein